MTEFGNKLQEAIESKNNDINTFVWKYQNGKEVKLMDCSREELSKFWVHCNEMLFNNNRYNPGNIL